MTLEFMPILVRNIFSCDGVAFCASSNIIAASLSVRPLIYANGAISTISWAINCLTRVGFSMSFNESNRGLRYGFIFSAISPGRNPNFSPASTAGLTRTIFLISCLYNDSIAEATARYVLPVPAGPIPKVMILSFKALQ